MKFQRMLKPMNTTSNISELPDALAIMTALCRYNRYRINKLIMITSNYLDYSVTN